MKDNAQHIPAIAETPNFIYLGNSIPNTKTIPNNVPTAQQIFPISIFLILTKQYMVQNYILRL